MKIRTFILHLLLATNGLCSWPDETVSAAAISGDPVKTLSRHFDRADEIYATASDYRGLTLKFNRETNQWDCSVSVAYYEVHSWLSDAWEDAEKVGWSRRPSNGLENVHSDLGSLVGILDEAEIEVRRVSTVRTDRESKDLRAIWNKLEFSVPKDRIASIYPFIRDLYNDYRPDTKVHIYTKKTVEQDGTGQPATRPESKSEDGDKPQPEAEGRSR